MNRTFEKLKQRWGVTSYGQVVLVLCIFAITGISTLYVKQAVFELLGLTAETAFGLKALLWLLVVLPAYQLLFLLYGFLLGQFEFVWNFEKRSFGRIKSLFVTEKPNRG